MHGEPRIKYIVLVTISQYTIYLVESVVKKDFINFIHHINRRL
jgi:hypothetical protein